MNIDKTPIPGFKAVEFFRQVKEELSREMQGKNFEEIKQMLQQQQSGKAETIPARAAKS